MPVAFRKEIAEFLRDLPGPFCSQCIASALALPLGQVTMTTLGMDRHGGFAMEPNEPCSRCGTRGRVIRAVAEEPG